MVFSAYRTIIFDCDGVVLNSNHIKTEAFHAAALPYGKTAAEALVAYHLANGGVSRYKKFGYFVENILPGRSPVSGADFEHMLERYAGAVRVGLMNCEVASGLPSLRASAPRTPWMIVSGGDQQELRDIFADRDLAHYFDAGIFGSPDDKYTIIERELALGSLQEPALFLGDSRLDYEVAGAFNLDFVFVSQWTEFRDWRDYFLDRQIPVIHEPKDLTTNLKR